MAFSNKGIPEWVHSPCGAFSPLGLKTVLYIVIRKTCCSLSVNYKQRKEESFNINEFTIKDVHMSEEQKYDSPAPDLQDNNPQLAVINDQDYVYQSLLSNNKQEDGSDIDFDVIEAFDSPDSSASSCMCCV
ncbi:unnamed protein product [Didymodactylos carnosus]|uniref:Uncharacterized protein n=1 Tax=Didymodactylos carnosus TaxID=1234261 RepID=A0A815JB68_9BILA|nr:unnamed protein product [Didymodactylos carnosus]CAF4268141.1 unnamed protein product [Didymodactylos carnosus]